MVSRMCEGTNLDGYIIEMIRGALPLVSKARAGLGEELL